MVKGFLTKQLLLVLPVFAVLLVALFIAYLSVSVDAPKISILPFPEEADLKTTLLNALIFVGIASLSLPFVYFSLKRGWISLVQKMFAIGGGLLTLSLSGVLTVHLYNLFPSGLVLIPAWLFYFFISFSIAFTVTGIFSEEMRNVMYMMYSSVAGSFLGMGIPMFSMVHILFALCIVDLVSYRTGVLGKIAHLSGETIFVRLRYQDRELMVGWGDLVYYSMLASYSLVNFGPLTAISSTLLILMGWVFTLFFTTKSQVFPGLPIPIALGIIPIVTTMLLSLNTP